MVEPMPTVRERKEALRERIWALIEERGGARFPLPLTDRIPNFTGAEQAAARAAELPEFKAARRIKCNPDSPQRAVRLRALRDGKTVFMSVPRLRTKRCFLRLDPARLGRKFAQAATIKGAAALGEPVLPRELGSIDLVIAGSVAVNARGGRVGKGGGYSDLEFALARTLGSVGENTPVITTVHELQVVDEDIPMSGHDVPLDIIVTPERVIRTQRVISKPKGIDWTELTAEQLAAMPPLAGLRRAPPKRTRTKRKRVTERAP